MLNTKILTNGCGITYGKQKVKTWVNILQLVGCNVVDASGPAVSNQWIINKTFLKLLQDTEIKIVIIQLTFLGKLDVEVDLERINALVKPDPLRNFVIDYDNQVKSNDQIEISGVWPSSHSEDHESKKQWYKWLFSPRLEREDLHCKLMLLDIFCKQRDIKLHVYQGYDMEWSDQQYENLKHIINNIDASLYPLYQKSKHYQNLGLQDSTVPSLHFQLEIAETVGKQLPEIIQDRIAKFKSTYEKNQ